MHPTHPTAIGGPAELICSIPWLIGYFPQQSVVLVGPGGPAGKQCRAITMTAILDDPTDWGARVGAAATRLRRQGCTHVAAVIVDDRDIDDLNNLASAVVVVAAVGEADLPACDILLTPRIGEGERWFSFTNGAAGVLPDPEGGSVAHRHRAAGYPPIAASDEALVALLLGDTDERRTRLAAAVAEPSAPTGESVEERAARRFAAILGALDRAAADDYSLTAVGPAELADALSDPIIRDAATALNISVCRVEAGKLWQLLTRSLPDSVRANAAALTAHHAYVAGQYRLSRVAVELATILDPDNRLANGMRKVIQHQVDPSIPRRFAIRAYSLAALLGVRLPNQDVGFVG